MPTAFKSWTEITARGPAGRKDEAIGLLVSAGSGAVIESNRSACDSPESAREKFLTACVAGGAVDALASLGEGLRALGWTMALSTIEDRDWSVAWRAGMRPIRLPFRGRRGDKGGGGRGLLVRTSWSKAVKRFGEAEVIIDPSMAFGTGSHPTTKMCLKALVMLLGGQVNATAKGRILDVGTGSGILLIAALKLGATGAVGLEIDPLAMKVARNNLRTNNVKARLSRNSLSHIRGTFNIITANLFSEELRRLAPELVGRLGRGPDKQGGYLVLSGILREQAPGLVSAYRGLGMRVFKRFVSQEWAALVLCPEKREGNS